MKEIHKFKAIYFKKEAIKLRLRADEFDKQAKVHEEMLSKYCHIEGCENKGVWITKEKEDLYTETPLCDYHKEDLVDIECAWRIDS